MSSPHLSLKVALVTRGDSVGGTGGKATSGNVLFHQGILLVPPITEPHVKLFGALKGDIGNAEAAPVEVDRLGWLATEIRAGEREEVLAKLSSSVVLC